MNSNVRGNKTYFQNGKYYYEDDNSEVSKNWTTKPCGYCGLEFTKEGHDGCLGELDTNLVMNACCGHGDANDAYI